MRVRLCVHGRTGHVRRRFVHGNTARSILACRQRRHVRELEMPTHPEIQSERWSEGEEGSAMHARSRKKAPDSLAFLKKEEL
jgi:hypothetical protein